MLTPAGPDHAQIASAYGILDYFDVIYEHHYDKEAEPAEKSKILTRLFREYETKLLIRLLDFLKSRDDVKIVGLDNIQERLPIVSFIPKNKPLEKAYTNLTKQKLMLGKGHFYAVRPLMDMKIPLTPGVIRISCLHYNSMDEIEQLIKGLKVAL